MFAGTSTVQSKPTVSFAATEFINVEDQFFSDGQNLKIIFIFNMFMSTKTCHGRLHF